MAKKRRTTEASRFDKIIKENLEKVLPRLMALSGIQYDRKENLPMIKLQSTIEREPDFGCLIFNGEYPKGAVFHSELETSVKALPKYDGRMLFYYGLYFQKLRKEVLQTLYYLGAEEPKFRNRILHKNMNFNYGVIWVRDFPHTEFIQSNEPEEVVFSILTDFQGKPAEEIIDEILKHLQKLLGNTLALQKFIAQLRILSQLRNLHVQTIKKSNSMLTMKGMSIEKDPLFQQGMELKTFNFVKNLLEEGFEIPRIARLADVSIQTVNAIKAEMELEKSIGDLLKKGVNDPEEIARQLHAKPAQVKKIMDTFKRR